MAARPNPANAKKIESIEDLKNLTELAESLNGEVKIICDQEACDQTTDYKKFLEKATQLANKKLQK